MKKILMILLAISGIEGAFAGSFISNHLIMNIDKDIVEEYISSLKLRAIGLYDNEHPMNYLLCEKRTDQQDMEYGIFLGKKISKELSRPVLYTLIHDSDILILVFFVDGEISFQYDSWPGYWDGEDQIPDISNLANLASFFDIDNEELNRVLKLEIFEEEYIFAEDLLEKIRNMLDISEYVYLGYTYAKEIKDEIIGYGYTYKEW